MVNGNGTSCACLSGGAYFDEKGNCRCTGGLVGRPDYDPVLTKPVVRPLVGRKEPVYKHIQLTTDQIRCRARQAPSGYHYGMLNGVCVLMTADGKPVQVVAASQTGANVAPVTVTENLVANAKAFVSNNPILILAAIGGIVYFATKK